MDDQVISLNAHLTLSYLKKAKCYRNETRKDRQSRMNTSKTEGHRQSSFVFRKILSSQERVFARTWDLNCWQQKTIGCPTIQVWLILSQRFLTSSRSEKHDFLLWLHRIKCYPATIFCFFRRYSASQKWIHAQIRDFGV